MDKSSLSSRRIEEEDFGIATQLKHGRTFEKG